MNLDEFRARWTDLFLDALGNNNPTKETLAFVRGWLRHEGGGQTNACKFNGLNTMEWLPGSWKCNQVGVKGFPTLIAGVYANYLAITDGNYTGTVAVLANNTINLNNLNLEVQRELTMWVSGKYHPFDDAYINAVLALAREELGKI